MGDSLLQGTGAPIHQPNQSSREACCLLGARIWDAVKELLKLIQPSDYNLLLLLHVGANDGIKSESRALGMVGMSMGAQVVVSIMLVRGKGVRRRALIGQVNN